MAALPDYGLLPKDRTFGRSLPAFIFPYLAYAALASPHRLLSPIAAEALRLGVVGILMLCFRRAYRLGPPLTARQAAAAVPMALLALGVWIFLYRATLALPLPWFRTQLDLAAVSDPGPAYAVLRALNSTLLVPLFEELYCRAYVGGLLAGMPASPGSFTARLASRMDAYPDPLAEPPTRGIAARGGALLFMAGHGVAAWPAALAYFGLITPFYRKTGSFRACVLVHGLVNFGISILAQTGPGMRFLWF